jgi:hypothetical protein
MCVFHDDSLCCFTLFAFSDTFLYGCDPFVCNFSYQNLVNESVQFDCEYIALFDNSKIFDGRNVFALVEGFHDAGDLGINLGRLTAGAFGTLGAGFHPTGQKGSLVFGISLLSSLLDVDVGASDTVAVI